MKALAFNEFGGPEKLRLQDVPDPKMLVTHADVRAGEDVLILGVGGGVSSAAVGIAKLCGARVWVTSASDAKLERARALGADECINYTKDDWAKVVFEKTARRGVDVVVENVGQSTWKQSLRSLRKGGRRRRAGRSRAKSSRSGHYIRGHPTTKDCRARRFYRRGTRDFLEGISVVYPILPSAPEPMVSAKESAFWEGGVRT